MRIVDKMKEKDLEYLLFVEDNEDHAHWIIKYLKNIGYSKNNIKHVKNGEEAVDYACRRKDCNENNSPVPKIILLDISLPRLNGFEVLRKLKRNKIYKTIPMIMLSISGRSKDIQTARDLGANDYLIKSYLGDDFKHRLKSVISKYINLN